jgi:hypothetical protein
MNLCTCVYVQLPFCAIVLLPVAQLLPWPLFLFYSYLNICFPCCLCVETAIVKVMIKSKARL